MAAAEGFCSQVCRAASGRGPGAPRPLRDATRDEAAGGRGQRRVATARPRARVRGRRAPGQGVRAQARSAPAQSLWRRAGKSRRIGVCAERPGGSPQPVRRRASGSGTVRSTGVAGDTCASGSRLESGCREPPRPGPGPAEHAHALASPMSSSMWYIMQGIQSKYSLSERLIRTIAAIRSFPHDNVEDLIRGGADVNCSHGTLRPLHCACMVSDADCAELLLEKGAEVNALDGYHRTALHYAAEKDEACVEVLLEYGADPNALDGNRDTPLHWAAFKNSAECVRALLESGATVNALDYNNDTPLSWAAMKGNLESVSILLDYGAEVRVINLKGQTPISRLVALLVRGLGTEKEDACFELLHRAVGHFELRKNGAMPREVARDQQLCEKLTVLCSAPGTLKTLSRYAVRRSLGLQYLPEAVKGLPLPASLKEYLLLLQ